MIGCKGACNGNTDPACYRTCEDCKKSCPEKVKKNPELYGNRSTSRITKCETECRETAKSPVTQKIQEEARKEYELKQQQEKINQKLEVCNKQKKDVILGIKSEYYSDGGDPVPRALKMTDKITPECKKLLGIETMANANQQCDCTNTNTMSASSSSLIMCLFWLLVIIGLFVMLFFIFRK